MSLTSLAGSPLRARLDTLRRDLRTVASDLLGRRGEPFELRAPLLRHHHVILGAEEALAPRAVRIDRVVRETKDAVTLHLVDPTGAPFSFVPGQFLTLLVEVGGETLRRAYSICSGIDEDPCRVAITSKRVQGGRVSNHLNDAAREGDALRVLGPSGSFTVAPDPARRRDLVLIGGGSGITPLFSIAKSVLGREPGSRVALIYGSRSRDEVIFREAIAALAEAHPVRLTVRHVLEIPSVGWAARVGRLTAAICGAELDALAPPAGDLEPAEFFVCGPDAMMGAVREALGARGVEPARIHEERFSSPAQRAAAPPPSSPQPITLRLRGETRTVTARPAQTILEAGLSAGAPMPFSCAMGGCGKCKVRLVEGEVVAEEPNCLSAEERAAGFVLACVSRAARPTTVEVA